MSTESTMPPAAPEGDETHPATPTSRATRAAKPVSSSAAQSMPSEPPPAAPEEDPDAQVRAAFRQLTVGSVIDGKYRIDKELGRGAMGVVVAATHVQLGERVALKFLHVRSPSEGEDFQARFRREAKVSARLKNEHVTRVIDVGLFQGKVPFMVMDFLVGTDLRELVKTNGPLPLHVALDYVTQICIGIAEAHALGIVHRDLKSGNLFVTKQADGTDLIKILDFGISKWKAEQEATGEGTKTGVILGSPKYMSPEQMFGSAEVDHRADVWAIGAIVYEMLTGKPPFDFPTVMRVCVELGSNNPPPSITKLRDDVTPELEAAIFRCFVRDRAARVQNVAELAGGVLDAVEAPFAKGVRHKIMAILDPKAARDPLAISGANALPTSSGAFAALAVPSTRSISASTRSREGGSVPRPAASDAAVSAAVSPLPSKTKNRALVWIALALIAAVGIAVVRMRASPGETSAPAKSAQTFAAPPPPAASAPAAPERSTVADVPSAIAAPPATSSAANNPPAPTKTGKAYGWHQSSPATTTATAKDPTPPPAMTTAAPPPPAPQPAPAPAKNVDPLDDRQ
jgi:serine/threonine-protein kinase